MLRQSYNEQSFSSDVIARWGDLSVGLTEDAESLHLQMAHLGLLCRSHPASAKDILTFLEEILNKPVVVSEIENAVAISFLDWTEVGELGLREKLPRQLSKVISDQWDRLQQGT